ncbi:MAG: NYN domain-containing protein [Solirubrobacteraceae bacterium]
MRWIVDGNNVMGSRPDGWWRDRPGAMQRLVSELDVFAAASGEQVLVVFDGSPRDLRADCVEVAFARRSGRDAADDEIVRRTAADPAAGDLTVVTSDRALAERVRAGGAAVEGAGDLLSRLE